MLADGITYMITILELLTWSLGLFGLIGTVLPFLPFDDWWVRDFDYPRVQLFFILALALVVGSVEWIWLDAGSLALLLACGVAMVYQALRILPYTFFWTSQVQRINAYSKAATASRLTLMMSNVLQSNRNTTALINLVTAQEPDILLTLETNERWEKIMDSALSATYPYAIKIPQENRYGMHLYSRLPLRNQRVNHFVSEEIPSIFTQVQLPSAEWITIYGVHPPPPSPTEEYASTGRDAELALVGREIAKRGNDKTIVAGDLNDVAWSSSTRLFQRISGLLDPRRGRGFYATYHANYWFMRWPLDHVFASPDFGLVTLKRLPPIGSDHFPILATLQYCPGIRTEQQALQEESGDQQKAKETIKMGVRGQENTLLIGGVA